MSVTSIAGSALRAAEIRLANSASNIANANTPGFTPTAAVQSPVAGGGVRVDVVAHTAPAALSADAETAAPPNVSLEREIIDSITASYDFKANLRVLRTQDEIEKSLLDILA